MLQLLQRLLLTAHLRAGVGLAEVAEYGVYRQAVLFFGLVDLVVREMWAGVQHTPDQVVVAGVQDIIQGS